MNIFKKMFSKANSVSAPVKASFWFSVCSVINKCIQLITVPIFTRLLTTNEYGEYSIFVSWQSIIIIIATLNLYSNVFNNGMLKYRDRRLEFTSALQGLTTTISFGLSIILLVFHQQFSAWIGLPTYIILLMMLEIMLMPGFEFWAAKDRFDYKYKNIIKVTLAVAVLNPIVGIIFVSFADEKGYARIISVLAVQIAIYLFLFIYNFIKGKKFFSAEYWKYALVLAIPLVPHYLSQLLLNQMDRIMISDIVGTDKAGIYSVAYSAAMVLQIVGKSIQNSFTPWIYKKIDANDTKGIKSTVNIITVIVALLNFLLICMAPEVIMLLGGAKYMEAIYVIPPVTCSCFLIFVYSMFCTIEFYFENTKAMMVVSVIGALLNFGTNYLFINWFGYYAAGYTTLFSYIVFVVAHYFVMRSVLRKNGYKSHIFDIRFIAVFSVIFVIVGVLFTAVYDFWIIRYVLLAIMAVVCVIKRKTIISKVKNIKK